MVTVARNIIDKVPGVRSEWRIVSPEQATKWLEGNVHNRPVRDAIVSRYAADMRTGRWRQTHQGIAFDEKGVLIDGQHRLFAVIEADAEVLLQVTYGLPMESQMVIDDGIRRTVIDVMKIGDEAMAGLSAVHAAVASRMVRGFTTGGASQLTRQQQALAIQTHWFVIDAAARFFTPKVRNIAVAGVIAVCAKALYHAEAVEVERFAKLLSSGKGATEQWDDAALVLRHWLLTRHGALGGTQQVEAYAKTLRAMQAFLKREKKFTRLYAVTDDPFPLPHSKKKGG